MGIPTRFISFLTAGSLALTASPALAHGIGVGLGAEANASANLDSRCKRFEGETKERCLAAVKLHLESRGTVQGRASHGKFMSTLRLALKDREEKLEKRFENLSDAIKVRIRAEVGTFVSAIARICNEQNDRKNRMQCYAFTMAEVAAKLKAEFRATNE